MHSTGITRASRSRRLLIGATVAVALAAGVSGCSDPGASDSNTLTVVAWKGEGTNVADMPALNAAFEAANPDIELEYKYVDNANYTTYNNPRLAGGNAADVIMVDRAKMVDWAQQGYLADLSDQPWVERQDPALDGSSQLDGKTYQLVSENIGFGLYVNLELLAAAGIAEPPTNWPDFIAALEALRDQGTGGLLISEKNQWVGGQLAYLMAANTVDVDWPQKYDAGDASFEDSWAPVIDGVKELFDKELVDPALSLGLDENVDGTPQFVAGKWAFLPQGAWALNSIAEDAAFDFAFIPFPGGEAGTEPKTFAYVGTGWAMNATAKNSAAAKAYIDFMSQPENATTYLEAEAAFSTLTDVDSPAVPEAAAVAEAAAAGNLLPNVAQNLNMPGADEPIFAAINALFLDPGMSTAEVLEQLDSTVTPTPLTK